MRCGDTAVSHARHMSLSILLKMELAALPGDSGERFCLCFTDTLVIIAGDAVRPVHPSQNKALNEGSPVLRCFGKANRNAQYHAPPGFSFNTNGNKYSTITYDVIPSHFGIGGIKEKMGYGRNGPISPFFKKVIELSRTLAYISSRDPVSSTYLIHHFGDFAGRNSLQIHLSNDEVESPVNSRASFKSRNDGSKGSLRIPYLRDIQSNLPDGSPNGTRFESIPLAIACWYTFTTFAF